MGLCPFTRSFYGCSFIHIGWYLMDPLLLIGRYLYSHWVLGARPGGIEFYRVLPLLGVAPRDCGMVGGPLWLLCFVTPWTLIKSVILLENKGWHHLWLVMYSTQTMVCVLLRSITTRENPLYSHGHKGEHPNREEAYKILYPLGTCPTPRGCTAINQSEEQDPSNITLYG